MKKNLLLTLCGTLISLFLLSSCEEWGDDSDDVAVTKGASNITSSKAVVSCLANVGREAYFSSVTYGVKYSQNKADLEAEIGTISTAFVMEGNEYQVTLAGLEPNTVYYYRAYVYIKPLSCYGKIKSFKTGKRKESKPEAVDLGLPSGTLWATINIGAESPEDFGDYFAWGETLGKLGGKTKFGWSTYLWSYGTETTLTKYCNNKSYGALGFADTLTELELTDDAASFIWGGDWRIPSKKQTEELFNSHYTTIEWSALNGVRGLKITSLSNGNSIFLPAAGDFIEGSIGYANSDGQYWSRTFYEEYCKAAWVISFNSNSRGADRVQDRGSGLSIRPVRNSK
ncbi:MAG: fibronectin type III domain-containing protein [Bacteroidaceae bacterium]|nr:fibronectin type III domain-containing protein [Bacteroidaceae bacterium]